MTIQMISTKMPGRGAAAARHVDTLNIWLNADYSANGRRAMYSGLRRMAAVWGSTPEATPWAQMRAQHIKVAIGAMVDKGVAAATINHTLAAVRGAIRALWQAGQYPHEAYNAIVAIKGVKGHRLPAGRDIPNAEIGALLRCCDVSTPAGIRNRAVIAMLWAGGLRRDELAGARLEDYNPANGRLVVIGKGNKERAVYVEAARGAMGAWLALRGNHAGALFCAINKGGRIGGGVTAQAIYNMLKAIAQQAGVAHFSPHDLRRTYIGNQLDNGVDVATIARQVGHASITTTARYDRRPEAAQQEAARRLVLPA